MATNASTIAGTPWTIGTGGNDSLEGTVAGDVLLGGAATTPCAEEVATTFSSRGTGMRLSIG